jgi:hypothetical protein
MSTNTGRRTGGEKNACIVRNGANQNRKIMLVIGLFLICGANGAGQHFAEIGGHKHGVMDYWVLLQSGLFFGSDGVLVGYLRAALTLGKDGGFEKRYTRSPCKRRAGPTFVID